MLVSYWADYVMFVLLTAVVVRIMLFHWELVARSVSCQAVRRHVVCSRIMAASRLSAGWWSWFLQGHDHRLVEALLFGLCIDLPFCLYGRRLSHMLCCCTSTNPRNGCARHAAWMRRRVAGPHPGLTGRCHVALRLTDSHPADDVSRALGPCRHIEQAEIIFQLKSCF